MKSTLLGALCFVVLCITLSLGLWPFHAPANDVTWLKQTNGVVLGKYGTILSSGPVNSSNLTLSNSPGDEGRSIEIWLQPEGWRTSATILSLYNPKLGVLFTIHQSLTDLELASELESASGSTTRSHFYVDKAFSPSLRRKRPVFVTMTSGTRGTVVYLDGALSMVAPEFEIPEGSFAGSLIVGDAPRQPDSFRGQIRGLALYRAELNSARVLRHYQTWIEMGQPDPSQDENIVAFYPFDEHAGTTVRNRVAASGALYIPASYTVVDKIALEPFWKEFNFSEGYWSGNLKNIIGLMPAGFCFYAFFMVSRPIKRAVLVTVALGTLISLTIETLQIYLPSRDSGTTDLITNTLGTYLGVLCYRIVYLPLVQRFPWLDWFAPSR